MEDSRPNHIIPDELREVLIDFTINYLLERPPRIVDYGVKYFRRLQAERGGGPSSTENPDEGEMNSEGSPSTQSVRQASSSGNVPTLAERALARLNWLTVDSAGMIGRVGAGEVYSLGKNEATWLFVLSARCVLESPPDVVTWCLNYCESERDRWTYPDTPDDENIADTSPVLDTPATGCLALLSKFRKTSLPAKQQPKL